MHFEAIPQKEIFTHKRSDPGGASGGGRPSPQPRVDLGHFGGTVGADGAFPLPPSPLVHANNFASGLYNAH